MFKGLKWHISLMVNRITFIISCAVMNSLSIINVIYSLISKKENGYSRTVDKYFAYLFFNGNPLLPLLYIVMPIIILMPFSTIDYTNRKLNIDTILKIRMGKKNYYFSQALTSFIGIFIITLFSMCNGFLLNFIFLSNTKNLFNGNKFYTFLTQISPKNYISRTSNPYFAVYPKYFFDEPVTYILVYILLLALFFGICGLFSYAVSLKCKRNILLAALPIQAVFFVGLIQKNNFEYNGGYINFNFNILDYLTVFSSPGKNLLIILGFCSLMLVLSICLIIQQIKSDQFGG